MAPTAPTKYRGLLHGLLQGSYTDITFHDVLVNRATLAFSSCSHFAFVGVRAWLLHALLEGVTLAVVHTLTSMRRENS